MKSSHPPGRSIALAYAITGLAVAGALVAVVGVSAGLFGTRGSPVAEASPVTLGAISDLAQPPGGADSVVRGEAAVPSERLPDSPGPSEVVYVDAPAAPDHTARLGNRRHEEEEHGEYHPQRREGDDE